MKHYFFDTSALAKLFVAEKGTEAIIALVEQTGDRFRLFSALTPLELRSALQRRKRAGDIEEADVRDALEILEEEMRRTVQMPLTQVLLQRAHSVVDTFGLRAADAIQLASAFLFAETDSTADLVFVAADKELLAAAELAGIETWNPEFA